MSLRIRRGTESQRTGVTFNSGELVWTTDLQQLWVGDGVTQGGTPAVGLNITGYGLTYNNTSHRLEVSGLTTDDITQEQGANNRWFSTQLAHDAVGPMFTGGSHSHISFQYDAQAGHINATVALDGVGITNVQADTSPTLGGNLLLNSHNITGTGNINITGSISNTGDLGVTGAITASTNVTSPSLTLTTTNIIKTTASKSITIQNNNQEAVRIIGVNTNGTGENTPQLNFFSSRGTVTSPAASRPGDYIFNLGIGGYYGVDYFQSVNLISKLDDDADLTSQYPGAGLAILTGDNTGGENIFSFSSAGVLTAPTVMAGNGTVSNPSIGFTTDGSQDTGFFHPGDGIIGVAVNAQELARIDSGGMRVVGFVKVGSFNNGILPSPAEPGMILLDTATNQFKGYNGTSWVVLG